MPNPSAFEFRNLIDHQGQSLHFYICNGQRTLLPEPQIQYQVIDGQGATLIPALVELFADFKEPGGDHIYGLDDGVLAMLKGGYRAALLSPETDPILDNGAVVQRLVQKTKSFPVQLIPTGAISIGLEGNRLSSMAGILGAGAHFLSNALRPTPKSDFLRSVMEYASQFESRLFFWPAEGDLLGKAFVHEGANSSLLGFKGIPRASEEIAVFRLISLAQLTSCPIHLHGISTQASLDLIAQAKAKGLDLSCDVAIHSLLNTDDVLTELNPNHHLIPPLRTESDRQSLIQGLQTGILDAICGFHRPVLPDAKNTFFEGAETGALSLEFAWASLRTLVPELSTELLIQKLSHKPAQILGLESNDNPLEFFLYKADSESEVQSSDFVGDVCNSPLLGKRLQGHILGSLIQGQWFPVETLADVYF